MTKKHISLKDLAKELNVSISTVTRGLKNHPDISEELAKKIQLLAKQRKYFPNPLAMGLLSHHTRTIGVIVPELVTYFFSSIISGIENFAKENNYFIIIASSQESCEKEKTNVENLLHLRVDGLIVCLAQDTNDYSHFDILLENETPIVFFDRVCRTSDFSSVVADNIGAAREITNHLIKKGCKNIGIIAGPKELNITKDRVAGIFKAIKENELEVNKDLLVYTDLSLKSAAKATHKLLAMKNRPDAICAINDTVAMAAMKEIKKVGLKIPEDIALAGFTDEFHATVVEPPLTSIIHPTFEMGQEAARLVIDQIEKENPHSPRQVVMKTKLVIRESSMKK
jgi:DNA-binding LacI/PurR family transcriptional regulator